MAPTRPADGNPIATVWGQDVHDRIFTPVGDRSGSGTASATLTGTFVKQDIGDGIPGSPGGWLDVTNDRMTCPTGKSGLYLVTVMPRFINGTAGHAYEWEVRRNGTADHAGSCPTAGSAGSFGGTAEHTFISAADFWEIAVRSTGGAGGTMTSHTIRFVRIGDAWPA